VAGKWQMESAKAACTCADSDRSTGRAYTHADSAGFGPEGHLTVRRFEDLLDKVPRVHAC